MAFQAVLARHLATLADQLTSAAAAEIEATAMQLADVTAARDGFRARAEELAAANDALSLELEASAAAREAAAATAATLESERATHAGVRTLLDAERARSADLEARLGADASRAASSVAALEAERLNASMAAAALEVERANADAAIEAERAKTAGVTAHLAGLKHQHEELQQQHRRLESAFAALQRAEVDRGRERVSADAALADLAAARDDVRAARERAESELAAARSEAAEARSEFDVQSAQLRQALASVQHEAAGELSLLREELALAREASRDGLVARLSTVFDDISRGASVDDVLSAAANGIAGDFTRVAVFAAESGRLEARYQRGFEPSSGTGQAMPSSGDGSLLGRAATAPELELQMVDSGTALPFAGSPSVIVTAPILVRGELLALIYADDDGAAARGGIPSIAARVADLICRHATLRLDRLTVELKMMNELRDYARMLLDEVEYVYRADVSARKAETERVERLTENLRCARQIYQQRVVVEGPSMAQLLEEVIAAVIDTKATTPFGRELASITATAHPVNC